MPGVFALPVIIMRNWRGGAADLAKAEYRHLAVCLYGMRLHGDRISRQGNGKSECGVVKL